MREKVDPITSTIISSESIELNFLESFTKCYSNKGIYAFTKWQKGHLGKNFMLRVSISENKK